MFFFLLTVCSNDYYLLVLSKFNCNACGNLLCFDIYLKKNPNYLQLLIKKIKQMIACYKIPNNSYTLNKPNSFI